MNIIDVKLIKDGAKIPITVSSELYARLQELMLHGLPFKDYNHYKTCIKEILDQEEKDPLTYHLHTLTYLIALIEESAEDNKFIKNKQFDTEKKEFIQVNEG